MKLYPKARPVQINKLKLGGYDIINMQDLLSHFYVSEIIDLGHKFLAWVRRNPELASYVGTVESNIKAYESTNDKEAAAVGLLCAFFHDKLICKEIGAFVIDLARFYDCQIVKSFLECVYPTFHKAMCVFDTGLEYECLKSWLRRCEKCFKYEYRIEEQVYRIEEQDLGDFYYKCAFMNGIGDYEFDDYIFQAQMYGNKESKNVVPHKEFGSDINVNIGNGQTILMKRVDTATGFFYIAYKPITGYMGDILMGNNLSSSAKYSIDTFKSEQCYQMLSYLNYNVSNYKNNSIIWDIPSASQWLQSYERSKISINCYTNKIGEWCYENDAKNWAIINTRDEKDLKIETNSRFSYFCFRPVFRILNNEL